MSPAHENRTDKIALISKATDADGVVRVRARPLRLCIWLGCAGWTIFFCADDFAAATVKRLDAPNRPVFLSKRGIRKLDAFELCVTGTSMSACKCYLHTVNYSIDASAHTHTYTYTAPCTHMKCRIRYRKHNGTTDAWENFIIVCAVARYDEWTTPEHVYCVPYTYWASMWLCLLHAYMYFVLLPLSLFPSRSLAAVRYFSRRSPRTFFIPNMCGVVVLTSTQFSNHIISMTIYCKNTFFCAVNWFDALFSMKSVLRKPIERNSIYSCTQK